MYQPIRYTRVIPIRQDVVLPEPPYAGPGDIVSGAKCFWGLRAYTLALVGNTVIRLRRDSDNAEQDFATITGGGLDLSSITSFKGAAGLFVVTLYDQLLGSFTDLTNSTAATQLQFILNGLGSKPVIRSTTGLFVRSGSDITMTQPFALSIVGKRTGGFTSDGKLLGSTDGTLVGWTTISNTMTVGAKGTNYNVSAADNTWHAAQFTANGASSDLNIDGTVNTGNVGSGNMGGGGDRVDFNLPTRDFIGDFVEGGFWDNGFTSGQSSSMSANQHSYWGF